MAGTTIVNNEILTIGEDDGAVSVVRPLILATSTGIDNNDTLNFYDGKVKADITLHGEVTQTPYSYNASISSEDNKEIMERKSTEHVH